MSMGIVTVEFSRLKVHTSTQVCYECHSDEHDDDANFCKNCGTKL